VEQITASLFTVPLQPRGFDCVPTHTYMYQSGQVQ
jgi:hypothetical protein